MPSVSQEETEGSLAVSWYNIAIDVCIQCDRLVPCSNCIARGKQSSCEYENESSQPAISSSEFMSNQSTNSSPEQAKIQPETASPLSALGYTKSDAYTSFGLYKKVDSYDPGGLITRADNNLRSDTMVREKYKRLIRLLPPRAHLTRLVSSFFSGVNWIYNSLDEDIFVETLRSWTELSFNDLNNGPRSLPVDPFFPALLFQVLALSLQFQGSEYDRSLNDLKYAAEMSLDDLASDYSDTGASILHLLGKRDVTLITVQAGFLRTSFLKNRGLVSFSSPNSVSHIQTKHCRLLRVGIL